LCCTLLHKHILPGTVTSFHLSSLHRIVGSYPRSRRCMVKECSVAQRHLASENGHTCRKKLICAGVADVSELRTQESRKSVGDFSPALFWTVGHQHHGLQSVQLVGEHLDVLGKGML